MSGQFGRCCVKHGSGETSQSPLQMVSTIRKFGDLKGNTNNLLAFTKFCKGSC